jgi:hypothetical protein
MAMQHDRQCACRIEQVYPEPRFDFRRRLLHTRNRRFAFHRAGADQSGDSFLERKLSPFANFAFERGICRGTLRVLRFLRFAHLLSIPKSESDLGEGTPGSIDLEIAKCNRQGCHLAGGGL